MEITDEQLQSYIALYKSEFGIELSQVEAQQSALSLLRLMAVSVKPLELSETNDTMELPDLN